MFIPALNLYVLPRLVTIPLERVDARLLKEIHEIEERIKRLEAEYMKHIKKRPLTPIPHKG